MRQTDKIIREDRVWGPHVCRNKLSVPNSNYLNFTKFITQVIICCLPEGILIYLDLCSIVWKKCLQYVFKIVTCIEYQSENTDSNSFMCAMQIHKYVFLMCNAKKKNNILDY